MSLTKYLFTDVMQYLSAYMARDSGPVNEQAIGSEYMIQLARNTSFIFVAMTRFPIRGWLGSFCMVPLQGRAGPEGSWQSPPGQ